MHQPVIEAIDTIRRYSKTKLRYFPSEQAIPLDFLPSLWRETVIDGEVDGRPRINRITYEIATLSALRDQVRCKEMWVAGADRYRNPEDDVRADYEQRRDDYYTALGLPRDPETLITELRDNTWLAVFLSADVPTATLLPLVQDQGAPQQSVAFALGV